MTAKKTIKNRPLLKLDVAREFEGGSERRTATYIEICEDSSTEPTCKLPSTVEFQKRSKEACAQKYYEVHPNDLPLSCPMPNMYLWDAHPKVYLPIEETGEVRCPYCSAVYTLIEA